ncbi:unnamed protein product [Alopecurus aequalis]
MAEQTFSCAWHLELKSGETKKFALNPGHCAWVDRAVLVDPASVSAGQSVRVCARSGDDQIKLELSAERPVAPVLKLVMLDEQLWLERDDDDSPDAVVRIVGVAVKSLGTAETQILGEGGEDQEAVLEEEEDEEEEQEDDDGSEDHEDEEMLAGTEFEWTDQEESDDDDGFTDDEDDEESDVTGFMRVAAVDEENQEGGGDSEILVLYRYTRFSAASSGGSVEKRGRTYEHQLRFIAAGLGARSLAWAGASLAPLIYPEGLFEPLRELWTRLASEVSLPPGAARVKVFVDVGILRAANCTQASIGHMRAALKDLTAHPWPERFTGMVLNLPEPMRCGHDEEESASHDNDDTDGEQRTAKRRRMVADGDNCSLCFDELEGDDLAAWPGCGKPHVFHGRCMELIIESKPSCPICRRGLYSQPKF